MGELNLKNDLPAALVVFLVALPLCLGIALASGAPLLSGIISGIIGGMVVGSLSRSHTSVSGPAAGLAAIVLSSINQLGAFEIFLTSLLLAGFLQVIMGLLKTGVVANYIPSNVIKGLLAAIGILLILKQIPHSIGYDAVPLEDYAFLQADGSNTFSTLVNMMGYLHPGALLISIVSIPILIYWDRIPVSVIKFFPASLFVVILGIILNIIFISIGPPLIIEPTHLVNLPAVDTRDLAALVHFPDLIDFMNPQVYVVALTLAAVASLETLLNIEALDKIDPKKRVSPPNRELIAQGTGNMLAGLFGGIPVTSVIVRSSVNIDAGNKSKFSSIIHGVLILVSIFTLVPVLNLIPLSSLAAILLATGYKLAKISLFKEMYARGFHQFVPFAATILAIVFTDLLTGILIGLVVSVFFVLRRNFRNPFTLLKDTLSIGEVIKLELPEEVSFLNKAPIKEALWKIPARSKVIIDATNSSFIDDDVLELILEFKTSVAPLRNVQLNVLGLKDIYKLNDHVQFVNVMSKSSQRDLSLPDIINLLKSGNERFVKRQLREKYYHHQVSATSSSQSPMAIIVSCIDSRASPEIVFDAGIGDLLIIRIAGNVCSDTVIGSIELAVMEIGAKLIVVMGHSNCGAINAAVKATKAGKIGLITSKIEKAIGHYRRLQVEIDPGNESLMKEITWLNARNSITEILDQSAYLAEKKSKNEIGIVPAYYDTSSGKVFFGDVIGDA